MTKEIDRILICVLVFILVFGVLYLTQNDKNHYISYQPREIVEKHVVPPPSPEPKKEERKLPCPGIIRPLSVTYEIINDIAIRKNVMKNTYFNCDVVKKINAKNGVFYMIQIKQLLFLEEIHIVQESDVIFKTSSLF